MHVRKLNGKLITPQYITSEDSMYRKGNPEWFTPATSNSNTECYPCKKEYQHVILGELYEGNGPLYLEAVPSKNLEVSKRYADAFGGDPRIQYLPLMIKLFSVLGKLYKEHYITTGPRAGWLKGIDRKLKQHYAEFHPEETPWAG